MADTDPSSTTDVEAPVATESTPLFSPENEPPPLKDMKEHTLKERAVAGTAAVACTYSCHETKYPNQEICQSIYTFCVLFTIIFFDSCVYVLVSTSLASMLLEHNPAVYVSGIIGCAISPYAAIQQEKITQVEALKQTNERLEEEGTQLLSENVRLKTQVQEMESSVIQLRTVKSKAFGFPLFHACSIDSNSLWFFHFSFCT